MQLSLSLVLVLKLIVLVLNLPYWPKYRTTLNVRRPFFFQDIFCGNSNRIHSLIDPENNTRRLSGMVYSTDQKFGDTFKFSMFSLFSWQFTLWILIEGITTTNKHMESCGKQKSVKKTFRSPTVIGYLFTLIVKKMNGDSLGAVTLGGPWNRPGSQIHTQKYLGSKSDHCSPFQGVLWVVSHPSNLV